MPLPFVGFFERLHFQPSTPRIPKFRSHPGNKNSKETRDKSGSQNKKTKKRFQKLTSQTSTGHRGTKKAGTAKFSVDLELPQSVQQRGSMAKKSQVCTGR